MILCVESRLGWVPCGYSGARPRGRRGWKSVLNAAPRPHIGPLRRRNVDVLAFFNFVINFCIRRQIPMNRNPSFSFTLTLACLVLCGASLAAFAQEESAVTLTQISSDPFTVPPGQHATEVEPHVLANGITLVSAFQTGRIAPGGATAIGWATSTDGGATWTNGFLPGLTTGTGRRPSSVAR